MPNSERAIVEAVEKERARCVKLMDLHISETEGMFKSFMIRIRNLMANGVEPTDPNIDFGEQMFGEDKD